MMEKRHEDINRRIVHEAELFLEPQHTVRSVAQKVHMSKSCVYKDLTCKLTNIGRPDLQKSVTQKLQANRQDAPRRGAIAIMNKKKETLQ